MCLKKDIQTCNIYYGKKRRKHEREKEKAAVNCYADTLLQPDLEKHIIFYCTIHMGIGPDKRKQHSR